MSQALLLPTASAPDRLQPIPVCCRFYEYADSHELGEQHFHPPPPLSVDLNGDKTVEVIVATKDGRLKVCRKPCPSPRTLVLPTNTRCTGAEASAGRACWRRLCGCLCDSRCATAAPGPWAARHKCAHSAASRQPVPEPHTCSLQAIGLWPWQQEP